MRLKQSHDYINTIAIAAYKAGYDAGYKGVTAEPEAPTDCKRYQNSAKNHGKPCSICGISGSCMFGLDDD